MKNNLTSPPVPVPPGPESAAPTGRLLAWLFVLVWLIVLGLALPLSSRAQLVANYAFAPSTGTFTELTGPTLTPVLRVDTGNTPPIPLGFTFQFEGVNYTSVIATSDGYLTFNPALNNSTFNNSLGFVTPASDPLIAGLWDDLGGAVPTSQAGYAVTGAPGSRVFTFEWLRWGWNYNAPAGSISFQIRLREGSNQVEMVYRPEAGAVLQPSASVGLRAAGGQGAGSYLSVTDLSLGATASSSAAIDRIAALPTVSGLTFTFTPPACPGPPPTYATLPVSQGFEATWASACATGNAAGASWRTTPLIGDQSWRRDDTGANALWRNPTGFLPTPRASQGARAAIFHSSGANAGSAGNLDLYVDLSAGGTKTLSFDYVNAASTGTNNPEKLEVLLSTDGGATFGATPLLTLLVAATYTPQSVTVPGSSATSVIRFRGTADFGSSDIGIDNVRVEAATCAPPTAPVLSAITSTGATLSFAASATASSYTVTYQAVGGPAQSVTPNNSPAVLTGLTPATIYTVSAVSNCAGGAISPPTPTITFTTAPANDLCANAQALTPASPCAGTAGTVGGATNAGGPPASVGTADDDVWYSFVATSTQHRIQVDLTVTNTDFAHQLFGPGSCPGASATALFSSDPPLMSATGLVVGQTYYVRVYSYLAVPLTPTAGGFTICVDRPSNVPANDECAAATALTNPGSTCAPTSGTVFGATQSAVSGAAGPGTADDDVWYSFVATNAAAGIYLTNTDGLDLVVNLRTGPCATGTSLRYADQASNVAGTTDSISVRNLTVGQTYYVRVYSYLATPATAANGTFTLCVTTPGTCASIQGFNASSTTTTATLGWIPGAAGVSYRLEYGPAGFAPGTGTVSTTTNTSTVLTGLTPATNYNFYLTQTCASGLSSVQAGPLGFSTQALPITCATPSNLTTANVTIIGADLSWTPGANAASYAVEYGPSGFAPGSGTVRTVAAPASSVSVSGLSQSTAYQFYVTQTCASGQGNSTRVGPVGFTTPGTTSPTCAPPTALAAGNITTTTADPSWTGSSGLTSYAIQYGPSPLTPGTGTQFIVNSAAPSVATTLTGLTPATTYQFYVEQRCASGQASVRVGPVSFTTLGAAANNLIVSTTQTVQGTYDNVTVTPTGVATLGGALVVNNGLTVQDGGRLNTNCQPLTGAGSFTLAAGGTLGICDPAGISPSGPTGAVRVGGARSFSADANYVYTATTGSPATGSGLPSQVRELTVNLASGGSFLSLTNPGLDVARVLRFSSGSLLVFAANRVRLLSGPDGTALVDNTGGEVAGAGTALCRVQRYLSPVRNGGAGYRHLSAPVASAPVSQLGSGGSAVVVNPVYNTTPGPLRPAVVPFPTVFGYSQGQVPATGGAVADFDLGWASPGALTELMSAGQGFTTQATGGQTLTFEGPFGTGPKLVTGLAYGPNAAVAGWHLLGNPYPSPLDWRTLSVGTASTDNLQNLGGAVYVFESSGPYAGTYRSYQNGIGDPLIASGQGFFVRTAGPGQVGTLRLTNANRVTTWSATNSTLNRSTADPRPLARLSLRGAVPSFAPDETVVYFEAGATAGLDARFDAHKLANPGAAVNLLSRAGTEELSINGLPELSSQVRVVPLGLRVHQPGTYTLAAAELRNFGPATVFLRDALTGALVNLSQQPDYSFQVAAGSLDSGPRFTLEFRPTTVTATRGGLRADQISLFPNPARQEFTVSLPAGPTSQAVTAELVNALGQTVRTRRLTPAGTGTTAHFDVRGLATGVYSLRLTSGAEAPVIKRLVIE